MLVQRRRRWANINPASFERQGRIQGARAPPPPLISKVVICQPLILYTINPPVSDMLIPAPSTPKYIPLPI